MVGGGFWAIATGVNTFILELQCDGNGDNLNYEALKGQVVDVKPQTAMETEISGDRCR